MKNYISAAQLWGLSKAYIDMCGDIKTFKELNDLKIERHSTKAYVDMTSASGHYMELLRDRESSCRKLGNKIVDFINERFDGNLKMIEKGYYDHEVVEKALKIIEENIVIICPTGEPVPEEKKKPRSEGVTLEEAYSLWKK
jgi:hypothetical protein